MDAAHLREKFGIGKKDNLRDCFTQEELRAVQSMECLVSGLVDCGWEYGQMSAALDKATSITKTTAEYMRQIEAAPQLTASGLTGDYRLLADFKNVVLSGHPTGYSEIWMHYAAGICRRSNIYRSDNFQQQHKK